MVGRHEARKKGTVGATRQSDSTPELRIIVHNCCNVQKTKTAERLKRGFSGWGGGGGGGGCKSCGREKPTYRDLSREKCVSYSVRLEFAPLSRPENGA